jgi:hypothetical protein
MSMVAAMLMSVVLIAGFCVLAYTLAVYALPFMLGVTAARFAYHTGAGFIGAGLVGFGAAVAAFGVLTLLFNTLRSPILRLIVALVLATPATIAGYAMVHGVTRNLCRPKSGGKFSASSVGHLSELRRCGDRPRQPVPDSPPIAEIGRGRASVLSPRDHIGGYQNVADPKG